jgi:opacity protein-like surface antigen
MHRHVIVAAVATAALLAGALIAGAQTPARPAPTVEAAAGYAGFADEGVIHHALMSAAARVYVSPRVAVGPEMVYMVGPDQDRDLLLTGNVTLDLRRSRPGIVVPYLLAGGGLFQHSDRFGTRTFRSREGAFTAGAGARAWVSDRAYVAGEYRVGWELHYRTTGHVGVAIGRH